MTLPTSGPLTLAEIRTEFGAPSTAKLNDMVRGGAYVPSGTGAGTGSYQTAPMTPNGGPIQIPTSPPLQISHFYGTSSGPSDSVIANPNGSCSQSDFPTGTTNCFIRWNSDGTVTHGGSGGGTTNHYTGATAWNALNGSGIDYSSEYSFNITSISAPIHSGTYLPTSTGSQGSACDISASAGPGAAVEVTFNVQIIRISDSAVMTTFTGTLNLDNT